MQKRLMKEPTVSDSWDDLPPNSRVVGKREPPKAGLQTVDALQRLANDLGAGRVTWPRGVWRFRTHEEADAWWTIQMRIRK